MEESYIIKIYILCIGFVLMVESLFGTIINGVRDASCHFCHAKQHDKSRIIWKLHRPVALVSTLEYSRELRFEMFES